jgi:hypothetical protein
LANTKEFEGVYAEGFMFRSPILMLIRLVSQSGPTPFRPSKLVADADYCRIIVYLAYLEAQSESIAYVI